METTKLVQAAQAGEGVFDSLMASVREHLSVEFKANRITGNDYAQVYLGSMQSAMQQAIAFLLQQEKHDVELAILQAQLDNIPKEGLVLDAQKCKLDAEFDLIVKQEAKTQSEIDLLAQRKLTEQAQINAAGVDADSVIGRQKELYRRQADGFLRDAEQKAAKIMSDIFNVLRTTAPETIGGNAQNKLQDTDIGAVFTKLFDGLNGT